VHVQFAVMAALEQIANFVTAILFASCDDAFFM